MPIQVDPAAVSYDPPEEEKIAMTVRKLRRGKSGDPSGMRGDNLKE